MLFMSLWLIIPKRQVVEPQLNDFLQVGDRVSMVLDDLTERGDRIIFTVAIDLLFLVPLRKLEGVVQCFKATFTHALEGGVRSILS